MSAAPNGRSTCEEKLEERGEAEDLTREEG